MDHRIRDDSRHLTRWIIEVAKDERAVARFAAGLDTRGFQAAIESVVAEVAGLRDAVRSRGVILVLLHMIFFEIEHSHVVGAGDQAIPATNTSVLVNDDDAVFAFVGCLDRADQGTGRIIAMVA
jgi:hypothetical protein